MWDMKKSHGIYYIYISLGTYVVGFDGEDVNSASSRPR